MSFKLSRIPLRFTTGHAVLVGASAPFVIALAMDTAYERYVMGAVGLVVVLALVTFGGRRLSGWILALFAWLWRRRNPLPSPSEPAVGATVMPGDHVAVRWQSEYLCALIELVPRPFTPTVVVDGRARTDDVIDTRLVEQLLSVHCPDVEADVVSAGQRIGRTAPADVVTMYEQMIGSDPAPAQRRTWIMLRAYPLRTQTAAQRRDDGVAGLARYLVSSTTRMADDLASHGLNALCERSFDDFDQATDIRFERERWSTIKGRDTFTAAYTASGGPDVWWAAPADHVITRFRIVPGAAPQSTVLLTTATKVKKRPPGFRRVSGGQRAALHGQNLVTDDHCRIPIGSAGVLVGETVNGNHLYLPFDDVDVDIELGGPETFTQFVVRAAAAGGIVTLGPRFEALAELIGAHIGPKSNVSWPHATTYLGPHPGIDQVILQQDLLDTPRHPELQIRSLDVPAEDRYVMALPDPRDRPSKGRPAPVAQ